LTALSDFRSVVRIGGDGDGGDGAGALPWRYESAARMIKYIGSKRALLGHVSAAVASVLPQGGRVCDLFSGTARVGHALKAKGFHTKRLPDGETVVASAGPIAVTADEVWRLEEMATAIALAFDFYPDGWELAE
jgi:hypothetical protein